MELKKILVGLEGLKAKGKLDLDITGLESNSKNIKEGYMFIAIKGYSVDGHDYINNAIEAGAKVVMACDRPLDCFAPPSKFVGLYRSKFRWCPLRPQAAIQSYNMGVGRRRSPEGDRRLRLFP